MPASHPLNLLVLDSNFRTSCSVLHHYHHTRRRSYVHLVLRCRLGNPRYHSISASATTNCEGEGNPCVGDVTHWDGGLGTCGVNVDTTTGLAIALPFAFMGTLSNTNPYCGRGVTLYNPTSGTMVQATVEDKCMDCVDRAIDCTDILFNQVTDGLGSGRMLGIEWWPEVVVVKGNTENP
jgi:hypothetical protein